MARMGRTALIAAALGAAAIAAPVGATQAAPVKATHAAAPNVVYTFNGRVATEPGEGAATLQVQVTGGNRPALKAMIGSGQPLTFTMGPRTRWIVWTGNVPKNGDSGDVHVGDPVTVNVAGDRGASLATLLASRARSVHDRAAVNRPKGVLYFFGGKAVSLDQTAKTVTVELNWGNWRALYAMLGQPVTQTFRYDDNTTFLTWKNGRPHLLTPGAVNPGDPLKLRIITARKSSMATLTATPAWKVNDREPWATTVKDKGDAE